METTTHFHRFRALALQSRLFQISAAYLLLTAYFYSFSQYGFNIWDEGGFANGTLRTLNGEKALQDFNPNGYLPGRYLYAGVFFKLFGIDVQSLRIAVLLFTPAMVLMVYAAARKLMPPGFAGLAALCMLSAPSMYYNRFFPFFAVLNLYLLMQAVDKRQTQAWLWVCAGILMSGYFKIEIALIAALVSALTAGLLYVSRPPNNDPALSSEKNLTPVSSLQNKATTTAVLALTGLLCALVLFFLNNDYMRKVFQLVFDAHRVWGNPFPDILPFFSLSSELGPHQMFERMLFYLPIWTYAITAVLLGLRWLKKTPHPKRKNIHLIIVLSFGIGVYGLVIWRAGFDNLLRTLPPFYILFCWLLHRMHRRALYVSTHLKITHPSLLVIRKTAIHMIAVALPVLFVYEMNVHHGFYAGSIGALKQETRPVQLARMAVRTHPAEAQWLEQIVDRIEIYSDPGNPILALPLNPVFYFLTGRINPTPYDWILPGMLDEPAQKKLVQRLKQAMPKLIVYVDIPIDGLEERRLSNYAPVLFQFIAEHYRFEEMIGLFQILLPKEPETAREE